ncbi:MAG: hypothetical protein HY782_00085 [Chloroflexi bacterium]|nr:hypothetical protein [Chloroflexota bacterium]
MDLTKWRLRFALAALIFAGALACRTADVFVAQATVTPTRTPRPTFTPLPKATNTPVPTPVPPTPVPPTSAPTRTATRRPPTATPRPPTAIPPPVVQPTAPPPVSQYEFHVNPATCSHSGLTYIKGTVYLDRFNPDARYAGAIVALGPPDGSTIYDKVKAGDDGVYTFVLSSEGQPGRPGTWGLWLVDPADRRKSDIGGPIVTNGLPADNPSACWAGTVDFWK